MIRLYNTLSREKDELRPINKEWVGLYTCGPTVYNFAHIGNLRTYIFEDILQRALEYNGHAVRRVMNITDVGHLTGDTDAGEEKMDAAARIEHKSVEEIAQFYTDAFFADLAKLNVKKPDIIAPATKFINEQVSLIETLMQNGFAYDTPTAVYFDVAKYDAAAKARGEGGYGKLSGQSLAEKSARALVGAREEVVVDREKHNAADFALWFKLTGKFKNHLLRWPSPWGDGFPGWHIECSAISRHFLGQPFDIHTGGVDHIGTHHENEIAQSEGAFACPLANIWMHGEHLLIDSAKMAKSEADKFITLAELEKRGYHPLVFRYLVLGAHYRTQLNFTWESLEGARNGLNRLYQMIYDYSNQMHHPDYDEKKLIPSKEQKTLTQYEKELTSAINDDLNTPQALALVHEMLADGSSPTRKIELIKKIDGILGLHFDVPIKEYSRETEVEVIAMQKEYDQLRNNKEYDQSDVLRKKIEAKGYEVRDTKNGVYLVKNFF